MAASQVFQGAYVHSLSKDVPFVIVPEGLIGVAADGKILFVEPNVSRLEELKTQFKFGASAITKLSDRQFLIPGFVDTHIHAPQYVNAGLGLDLPLLEWLDKYTFPTEAKFANEDFARECYSRVVDRTLRNGTTTASYFATIHRNTSEVLAELCDVKGQRALVGKVSMDIYCPDYYIEASTEEAIREADLFVKNVLAKQYPRVKPTITPRFALTCTAELMAALGKIAKDNQVHVQTHLNESLPEIARAEELFPNNEHYADIYEQAGLLGKKSIMAHCVHMKDAEVAVLQRTQTSIAHCPNSNTSLNSGFSPIQKFVSQGVTVGLGTDVSGGFNPTMLDAMRFAISVSKSIQISQDPNYNAVTYKEAVYLATLGGAQALSLDHEIGNFQPGKKFDALFIDMTTSNPSVDVFEGQTLEEVVQKFIYLGDDRNIRRVFVDGVDVLPALASSQGSKQSSSTSSCSPF